MSTYYHSNNSAKVAGILRDGFSDEYEHATKGISGVYVTDAPGEPDPAGRQLLEISLPAEISITKFEICAPKEDVCWQEFLVPAHLLNECAEIRPVPKIAWDARWRQWKKQYIESQFRSLIECGLVEVAKDSEGRPIYRNGQLVYRTRDKSKNSKRQLDMPLEDL
jgi:hypothetical protein